jgi:hypothetical protein
MMIHREYNVRLTTEWLGLEIQYELGPAEPEVGIMETQITYADIIVPNGESLFDYLDDYGQEQVFQAIADAEGL